MSHVDGFDDGVGYGVYGESDTGGDGVVGKSYGRRGVFGIGFGDVGVLGWGSRRGVGGWSLDGPGIHGSSNNDVGVYGFSNRGGVFGVSNNGTGLFGASTESTGVAGTSFNGWALYGHSVNSFGLYVYSKQGYAAVIDGNATVTGGLTVFANARVGWDLRVNGNLKVDGTLQKGGGSFRIDHPLDPANKYLSHSFVESPDMKNVYDGVAVLDNNGEAEIELPDWFSALNKDFRYQLTAIGAPGPNLYIAEEVSASIVTNNSNNKTNSKSSNFKIAGGISGMKVSWQVTGIRQDPWANSNQIQVEEDKPAKERGYYMYPDLYGQPEEKGINRLLSPEEEWQEQLLFENKQPRRFR